MEHISYASLERYSYRNLQQIAKSLALPSNVKKMYLIEMIIAKKHCTEEQLNAIITRVKDERRKIQSLNKKNKKTGNQMQATTTRQSTSQQNITQPRSPPISGTPKRSFALQYTPDVTISKFQPKTSIQKALVSKFKESDRILRSYNSKKPSYGILECKDTHFKIVKAQKPLNLCAQKSVQTKISVCVKKVDSRILPVLKDVNTQQPPKKRQRTLSGIPFEKTIYEYLPSVRFGRNDGKVTKIIEIPRKIQQYHPIQVTMQEVINRKVDNTIREFPKNPSIDKRQTNVRSHGTLAINYKQQNIDNEEITTVNNNSSSLLKPPNTSNYSGKNTLQTCRTSTLNNNGTNTLNSDGKVTLNKKGGGTLQTYGKHALQGSGKRALNYGTDTLDASGKSALNCGTNEGYRVNICYGNNSKTTENSQTKPSSFENPILHTNTYTNVPNMNSDNGNYTVYYHKKIRSDQVRRVSVREDTLPRISEVFSQFHEVQYRSVTQPLFVEVSQESESVAQQYVPGDRKASMLETLYNLKLQFVTHQPLLAIATTANTRCVFSTCTAPTAVAHPPPPFNESNINISHDQVNPYNHHVEGETRIYDYLRMAEQEENKRSFACIEGKPTVVSSSSSADTSSSQELGADVTIPEMVEDALEIISQDGDYMERLGLDLKMQCVLCEWAGSKIILEYHVQQTHQNEILYTDSPSFTVVITLGALVAHEIWLSRVIQYKDNIYVVSASYNENCISLILTMLSETDATKNGQITIYNKITGKPFTWQAEIPPIPDTLPFTSSLNCLKLDITDLDLLPNSAYLKLVDNELKIVSDNKVVMGQPSLNDIEIVLHVTVFD